MLKKELVKIFLPVNRFEATNEFEPNFLFLEKKIKV